jgi:UDP-glucose 4-epimerase
MRVVITGATGNCGTALIRRLADEPAVDQIVGVARRRPEWAPAKTVWQLADVGTDDLLPAFAGADVVVHLAWQMQPSRNLAQLLQTNLQGSRRVFETAAAAGVRSVVYASSLGAYSPAPRDRLVDESWPTEGIPTSRYSKEKASVERILDRFESRHPEVRVVRVRPCLIFQRGMGAEAQRSFLGPLVPRALVRPEALRILPLPLDLRAQAVHTDDVAELYRLAIVNGARGAYNVSTDPVLDPATIARLFHARHVPVPGRLARAVVSAAWQARMIPVDAGWVDIGLQSPLLDSTRAREELNWTPTRTGAEALLELVDAIADGVGFQTPPLDPSDVGAPSGADASPDPRAT